ncbi:DUF4173 domain-containing protein [Sulfitobacter albidus]|uniref:DUF4173 domain-containing protein n=1 Tax=Sulfitobacter albidus TaxID=2829501 RepID=A0A975PM80_9RHOB|nr:DUF4173 domain-containing protein [Sulfitobacter albidus]QUJ76518.1 DUF4173 domain-containing protein [Sulfitobacter albidus]
MKTVLLSGVPQSLRTDAWWMDGAPAPQRAGRAREGWQLRCGLLVVLLALGDWLVWQAVPGLSLAVFALALVAAAVAMWRRRVWVLGIGAVAALPLVEVVNPLTVMIAVMGVSGALVLLVGVPRADLWRAALRLWPFGIAQGVVDAGAAFEARGADPAEVRIRRALLGWLMPLGLSGVFALLLIDANPVLLDWLSGLDRLRLPDGVRVMFWAALVPLIWTVLNAPRLRERLIARRRAPRMGPAREGLINPVSIARALVLFNALFAVQTLSDGVFLYAGIGLPEGMNHAEYAHRGAYPLVITALLAGLFGVLSGPWVQARPVLRALLIVFVVQNVGLVLSALFRLDLYVDAYGLTRLRVAAAIWMGLVAGGLALMLWQIVARRGTGWLMGRVAVMAAGVLYAVAFLNTDGLIARHNLAQDRSQSAVYLCRLGEAVIPFIAREPALCPYRPVEVKAPRDWREWGFRNHRTRRSLAAVMQTQAAP